MKSSKPKRPAVPERAPNELLPQERAAFQRIVERRKARTPPPTFKVIYTDTQVSITPDHQDAVVGHALLADALATGNTSFSSGLLEQVANIARSGKKLTPSELNFMLAMIHEIAPRDPLESLLASQMAAVHNATMVAARRLNHCETITQQDSASNMLNKLARTFAAQLEALKRYRSTGEQNVRVTHQHVNVNANQAVVGINPGGGGIDENKSQSHALAASAEASTPDACGPALLGHEQTLGVPMPGTGRERAECVPNARGASRGAEGKS